MLHDRPQGKRREKGQRADDDDHADQEDDEKAARRSGRSRRKAAYIFWTARFPASAMTGMITPYLPISMASAVRML